MIRNGRRLLAATVALSVLGAVAFCAGAGANHSLKEQISVGPNGGNGPAHAFFDGNSADGAHTVFDTTESLVTSDTDAAGSDIYDRVGNVTSLVSTGPSGGNAGNDAFFDGISDDGAKIFFDTDERLVPADTDNSIDVYMRSGGTTTLISTGSPGGNGAFDVTYDGSSRDGSHVFFETDESLVPADTDGATDIYDRSGGTTTLVSTGPSGGGSFFPIFDGSSDDGTHVFFDTDEPLVAADTDTQFDTYDRSGGTTTLVSTSPTAGNGAFESRFVGSSANGSKVWFETREAMVPGDTDPAACGVSANQPCNDVYERSGGTTSWVSTGGNGAFDAFFDGSSRDGGHVFFHTPEALVGGDTDAKRDVYDRSSGTTTLLSVGPSGGNGAIDAFFDGSSVDGSRVFFDTAESLVTADTDIRTDVYERVGATTNRLSTGSTGGNGASDALFESASQDGLRVFLSTPESLEPTDTDTSSDVYERWNGTTTHITIGPSGGNAAIGAFFDGASADGTRVLFNTRESLVSGDTDTGCTGGGPCRDIYAATVAGFPRPKGASPLRASLVPAYQQCSTPNSTHGAPLAFPSCNPPAQASGQLTVGTPDTNGAATNMMGSVKYETVVGIPPTPPNEADVKVVVSITDVRQKVGLADYTGQLQVAAPARVTDRFNGASQSDPGTGDADLRVTVPCVATGATGVGATCSVSTTFNAVTPGAIVEQKRAIWALGQVNVFDGGPDGLASTSPNTLFATQGVFIP